MATSPTIHLEDPDADLGEKSGNLRDEARVGIVDFLFLSKKIVEMRNS